MFSTSMIYYVILYTGEFFMYESINAESTDNVSNNYDSLSTRVSLLMNCKFPNTVKSLK